MPTGEVTCTTCSRPVPAGARACGHCSSILPAPVGPDTGSDSSLLAPGSSLGDLSVLLKAARVDAPFHPGARLGTRYEIVTLLGKGGMGAVYRARDLELNRDVALTVVAPHLAAEEWVIERFKREIHLSTIVTHPNVLRVFDLGESDGIKFLTMQFIEGETLADLLRREHPLPLERSLALFRQVCAGLAAAHAAGVLHRDLKPQNVMVDDRGHVYLTDFGLATSGAMPAMTQTGALLGTPHYMSPEQVKGEDLDARSDVFSAGCILYEMLAGAMPYSGHSTFDVMMARTRAPARPVSDVNDAVPRHVQRVLECCMAMERAERYGSVAEVIEDLDAGTARPARRGAALLRWRSRLGWRHLAAAVALAALAAAPFAAWRLWRRPATAPREQTILVADFDNRTGEDVFNGTLEPAFGLALEGASFLSAYSRAAAQKLAGQLKLEGSGLSERRARLVAQREGIAVVIAGFVDRESAGYRVGVRAVDAFTGRRIVEDAIEATDKQGTLGAAARLAARVRSVLGDATPIGVQLKEAETFSAASLEAAHEYGVASDLAAVQGKYGEARQHYLEALRLDPGLGRAYSGLAVIERNGGHRAEAEKYFEQALAHVDRMTEREKLRTRGLWFFLRRDDDKAIEAFEALVKQFPGDNAGLANLAVAYGYRGDFARAVEYTRRAVALSPSNIPQRNNLGLFAMYVGDFETALREQARVLEANPQFENALFGLALAQLATGRRDDAMETWKRLAALGPEASSAATAGLADLAVFEGRLSDAKKLLEDGIEADRARKDGDGAARKLGVLADVYLTLGDARHAGDTAERALEATREELVLFSAASVLAEVGRDERALAVAGDLDRRLEPEPRMYAELLRGVVEARRHRHAEAIARFKNGVARHDSWLARFALARAYLEAGAFTEADDELDRCEKRRGEATDVSQETVPTYRLYAHVAYWHGRVHEALKSPAAAEEYRAFLAVKRSDEDPLVVDARRRLANR